jgi:sulfur carrier protein
MTSLSLTVNGDPVTLAGGTTVADVVAQVTGTVDPKGVAVAVDREVIPRSEWHCTPVADQAQVEVVTAAAGG